MASPGRDEWVCMVGYGLVATKKRHIFGKENELYDRIRVKNTFIDFGALESDTIRRAQTVSFHTCNTMQPPLPSKGSARHCLGRCTPCAFFHRTQGCLAGTECSHCHLCDFKAYKQHQKQKKWQKWVATRKVKKAKKRGSHSEEAK